MVRVKGFKKWLFFKLLEVDMEELTEKEKQFLLDLLYKCDWTQAEIADEIIRKLKLTKEEA